MNSNIDDDDGGNRTEISWNDLNDLTTETSLAEPLTRGNEEQPQQRDFGGTQAKRTRTEDILY